MKCAWPTQDPMPGDPMQTIFHWLALGVCLGGNANFMFRVGGNANFSVFRYQHVGIPNRVGGLDQRKAPTREFCISVEYRL